MPRLISSGENLRAISLMLTKDDFGGFLFGQRELEKETGLSRPYLRKLARSIDHQFPRNGIEVRGKVCVCGNCGVFFRRSPSKVTRALNNFCDEECKNAFMRGPSHPSWKTGKYVATFSKWIQNQSEYKRWKEAVWGKYGGKCAITGRTDDLDCHHIFEKAKNQQLALDPENGILICKEVHRRIHELIREGKDVEEALIIVKKEYEVAEEVQDA